LEYGDTGWNGAGEKIKQMIAESYDLIGLSEKVNSTCKLKFYTED